MGRSWLRTLVASEVVVLVLLLLLAAWRFAAWSPSTGPSEDGGLVERLAFVGMPDLLLVVFVSAIAYGLLQVARLSTLAFWALAALVILAHIPGIWAHNNLRWQRFCWLRGSRRWRAFPFGDRCPVPDLPCRAGVLHRIIALRKLGRTLTVRRADDYERDMVLRNEGLTLAAVIVVGLAAAIVLALIGTALGQWEWLFGRLPWTLVTIGGGASLLFAGCIALYIRSIGGPTEKANDSEES